MTYQHQRLERVTKALGGRIKNLRVQKGLSQMAMAQISGLSAPLLFKIEQGDSNPSISNLLKIAGTLKISLSQLFQGLA